MEWSMRTNGFDQPWCLARKYFTIALSPLNSHGDEEASRMAGCSPSSNFGLFPVSHQLILVNSESQPRASPRHWLERQLHS